MKKGLTIIGILLFTAVLCISILSYAIIEKNNRTYKVMTSTESLDTAQFDESVECTITFCDYENKIIKEEKVIKGKFLTPPSLEKPSNTVFTGWNSIKATDESQFVHPQYINISDSKNVFYFDCIYSDITEINVNVRLGGLVELGKAKLRVVFDTDALYYVGADSKAKGIKVEKSKNYVDIILDSKENICEDSLLAELRFKTKLSESNYCTEINLLPKDAFALKDNKLVGTEANAYKNKIYILKGGQN